MLTRREWLALPAVAAAAPAAMVDFHAHVEEPGRIDEAVRLAAARGIRLGVVWHAGRKELSTHDIISDDAGIARYLKLLDGKPVFKGIQAEGLDWMNCFSRQALARLDFVLTDALTFRERDGRFVKLWLKGVDVGDPQDFMDRYVDYHLEIMAAQPIDILANPTFLPEQIAAAGDRLWTPVRRRKLIEAARRLGIAIEINARYRIPGRVFLEEALQAGVKFSFGSNEHGADTGNLDYCREMASVLKLDSRHLFTPAPPGRKPVERRA